MKDNFTDDFYNWLQDCPCQWFRESKETNTAKYIFIAEDREEE